MLAWMLSLWLPVIALLPVQDEALRLSTTIEAEPIGKISRGTFTVFENRMARTGRKLALDVVVLHSRAAEPNPDPVFWLAGGPGQNAASLWSGSTGSWIRDQRDMVFVSQRGTGGDHRLHVALGGSADDFQADLDPIFDEDVFRDAMVQLSKRADLTRYSTPDAMDDLDDLRAALGYETINLFGGSYGTRAALVYLRRHPDHARCAVLNGVAPISFKNPLFHARAAQRALDRLFEQVESDDAAQLAFPDLRVKFEEILQRLEAAPVTVSLERQDGGDPVSLELDRDAFCEALRTLSYGTQSRRSIPRLLLEAHDGDFRAFARQGLLRNRGIRQSLAFGMLMCVTAAEDLARITEEEIVEQTRGTYLGDGRVRAQRAVAAFWPKSKLDDEFGEDVAVDVPVLLLSGSEDPVTPPEFGEVAHRHLPRSLHAVVPGAHGVGGPEITRLTRQFLDDASVEGLDLGPLEGLTLPPFEAPRTDVDDTEDLRDATEAGATSISAPGLRSPR